MKKLSCFFEKLILIFTIFSISLVMIFVSSIAVLKVCYPVCYKGYIDEYANKNGLEPAFVLAVINTESGFYKYAKSNKGAMGLMQLMPSTAEAVAIEMGVESFSPEDLYIPEINIMLGCNYLNYLFNKFETKEEVLFAYNAGEGTLRSYKQENGEELIVNEIDIKETKNFIKKVMRAYKYYSQYYV